MLNSKYKDSNISDRNRSKLREHGSELIFQKGLTISIMGRRIGMKIINYNAWISKNEHEQYLKTREGIDFKSELSITSFASYLKKLFKHFPHWNESPALTHFIQNNWMHFISKKQKKSFVRILFDPLAKTVKKIWHKFYQNSIGLNINLHKCI